MSHRLLCAFVALLVASAISFAQQATATPGILRQLNDAFAAVFEKVAPSVVVIETGRSSQSPISGLPHGLQFFLMPDNDSSKAVPNIGSGFIIRPDGHIVTNYHVIEGAQEISVSLRDGRRFSAELLGVDEKTDLAIIKIAATNLPPVELADSDHVKVGEFAFAVGTPMELPYTFTVGVVSAKGRHLALDRKIYDEFIQTDASISPGNSGGPLCDIEGRVVGVNTLISGLNRGLGFAIPSNIVKNIADQLITSGRVRRPWLGISIVGIGEIQELQQLFPALTSGVVVQGIEPNAPAQSSDLRAGDVILKVDGVEVAKASDLQRQILEKKIGQNLELEVWRGDKTLKIAVKTGEQPDNFLRASTRQTQQTPAPSAPNMHSHKPHPVSPGITVRDASPEALSELGIHRQESGGVIITEIDPLSAAAVAGLQPGDIITEAGSRPILKKKDFTAALESTDPNRGLLILFERNGSRDFAILKP